MPEKRFNQIAEQLAKYYDINTGKMSGKPCIEIYQKKFATLLNESMAFRLGSQEVKNVIARYEGASNWNFTTRSSTTQDWVEVPFAYKDNWEKLATEALHFVSIKRKI